MEGEVLVKFVGDTSNLDNKTKSVTSSFGKLTSAIALGNVAAKALTKTFDLITNNMDRAIQRVDTMNNFPKVLELFGVSADEANESIKRIDQSVRGLPTALDQAVAGVQDLFMVTKNLPEAEKLFQAVNDSAMVFANGSTDAVDRFIYAYKQSISMGKIKGQEFNQMNEAIPGLMDKIAESMSITYASLKEQLSDGNITVEQFNETLKKLDSEGVGSMSALSEAAHTATGGIKTSLTNMKTAFARGVANIIKSVDGALQPFGGLTGVISQVGKIGEKVFSTLGEKIGQFLPIVLENLQKIFPIVKEIFSQKTSALMDIAKTILPLILDAIKEIKPAITDLLPVIGDAAKSILPVLIDAIKTLIPLISNIIKQLLPVLADLIKMIVPVLVELAQSLLPIIAQIIQELLPILMSIIQAILPPLIQIIQAILPSLLQMISAVIPLLQPIADFLMPIIKLIMSLLPLLIEIVQAVLPPLVNLLSTLMQAILPILTQVIGVLSEVIRVTANITMNTLRPLLDYVENVITTATNMLAGLIDFVKNVFAGNWKGAWESVFNIFKSIISGIGNILKMPLNTIINGINVFIKGLNHIKIPNWVPGVGGKGINIPLIPKLATGTNYVPDDMIAMIHEGEAVVPKKFNPYANGMDSARISSMQNTYNPNIQVYNNVNIEQDPLGQLVHSIKTYSGGSPNDYNYGVGVS